MSSGWGWHRSEPVDTARDAGEQLFVKPIAETEVGAGFDGREPAREVADALSALGVARAADRRRRAGDGAVAKPRRYRRDHALTAVARLSYGWNIVDSADAEGTARRMDTRSRRIATMA